MNIVSVKAEKRGSTGSKYSQKLRLEGKIPAMIDRCDNPHIIVSEAQFTKALKERKLISHIFDIEINGVVERVVLKDYQKHTVTGKIINLDFVKIHEDKFINLTVPIFYINKLKAPAIKKGAFLNVSRYFVTAKFLGSNIIPYLVINLEADDVYKEYKVRDLQLPETAKMIDSLTATCANYRGKRGQVLAA